MRDRRTPLIVALLLLATDVSAEKTDGDWLLLRGWFVLGGLAAAYAAHPDGADGAAVGGEASAGYRNPGAMPDVWLGGYVDGLWDTGSDAARFSVGPAAGYWLLGVDGGYALETNGEGSRSGVAVRGLMTAGLVGVFARWDRFLIGSDQSIVEFGLLAKLPLLP